MYKKGQKVKVLNSIKPGKHKDVSFNKNMELFLGKFVTIDIVNRYSFGRTVYGIKEDKGKDWWQENWFILDKEELAKQEKLKKQQEKEFLKVYKNGGLKSIKLIYRETHDNGVKNINDAEDVTFYILGGTKEITMYNETTCRDVALRMVSDKRKEKEFKIAFTLPWGLKNKLTILSIKKFINDLENLFKIKKSKFFYGGKKDLFCIIPSKEWFTNPQTASLLLLLIRIGTLANIKLNFWSNVKSIIDIDSTKFFNDESLGTDYEDKEKIESSQEYLQGCQDFIRLIINHGFVIFKKTWYRNDLAWEDCGIHEFRECISFNNLFISEIYKILFNYYKQKYGSDKSSKDEINDYIDNEDNFNVFNNILTSAKKKGNR